MRVVEIKKQGGPEVLYIGSRPIPKPKKGSLLASKKLQGGVIMDMGPYAASIIRLFTNNKIKRS